MRTQGTKYCGTKAKLTHSPTFYVWLTMWKCFSLKSLWWKCQLMLEEYVVRQKRRNWMTFLDFHFNMLKNVSTKAFVSSKLSKTEFSVSWNVSNYFYNKFFLSVIWTSIKKLLIYSLINYLDSSLLSAEKLEIHDNFILNT